MCSVLSIIKLSTIVRTQVCLKKKKKKKKKKNGRNQIGLLFSLFIHGKGLGYLENLEKKGEVEVGFIMVASYLFC